MGDFALYIKGTEPYRENFAAPCPDHLALYKWLLRVMPGDPVVISEMARHHRCVMNSRVGPSPKFDPSLYRVFAE